MPRWTLPVAFALVCAACGSTEVATTANPAPAPTTTKAASYIASPAAAATSPSAGDLVTLDLELITDELEAPVTTAIAPGDGRLFIVEQAGRVRVVLDGVLLEEPYLDIERFVTDEGLEQGLLGLAFHPDFASNGKAYVSFTNVEGHSRIIEYTQSTEDPNRLKPDSARLIYGLEQPHEYHNGGSIVFGPDGNLWAGFGDGGSVGDPWENGQNPSTALGTVVRIDVSGRAPYSIPPDNPFADGVGGAPEVWAYGLRNPWRLTFAEDTLLIADVGHDFWEEVNVSPLSAGGGENYGWPVAEGPDCFESEDCDRTGFAEPDLELFHERLCAIVGGPVYSGSAIPELNGHYFFGDFCVGWVRSAPFADGQFAETTQWSNDFGERGQVTSIGEDPSGELVITYSSGEVYRVVPVRN